MQFLTTGDRTFMDGLLDHMSNLNYHQLQQQLEDEEYDTDAVLQDVPAKRYIDPSQSNIAIMCTTKERQFRNIKHHIYLSQCMFITHL